MFIDLNKLIEQLCKDRGVDKQIVTEALEKAMVEVAHKHYGIEREIEAHYNNTVGEVELFEFKTVVEKVEDESSEISINEAKKLDSEAVLGDSLGVKLDNMELGRIGAQHAKQIVTNLIKEAERELVYGEYSKKVKSIVNGVARRLEKNNIVVDLGKAEATLPLRDTMPGDSYKSGDRVVAYLVDVQKTPRGPLLIISRTVNDFLAKMFEAEVPEIAEGIIDIKSVARDPGRRAKIAVYSSDTNVDPVGACVGVRGSRVQSIMQELRGEKIDIIVWSSDVAQYIKTALAPAEVYKITLDEAEKRAEVVVSDSQLSLAIGKKGQNVRLAAQLTGWNIDILSESRMNMIAERSMKSLQMISGIDEAKAKILYNWGLTSFEDVAIIDEEELLKVEEMEPKELLDFQKKAKKLVEDGAKLTFDMPELTKEETKKEEEGQKRWIGEEAGISYTSEDKDLASIPSLKFSTITKLNNAGYFSIRDVVFADIKDLSRRTGFTEKQSEMIIEKTKQFMNVKK